MKIVHTDDPQQCGYNATTDTATITTEDRDHFREVAKKIRRTFNAAANQKTEREFHEQMLRKYGKTVAGEMLYRLWKATSKERNNE